MDSVCKEYKYRPGYVHLSSRRGSSGSGRQGMSNGEGVDLDRSPPNRYEWKLEDHQPPSLLQMELQDIDRFSRSSRPQVHQEVVTLRDQLEKKERDTKNPKTLGAMQLQSQSLGVNQRNYQEEKSSEAKKNSL